MDGDMEGDVGDTDMDGNIVGHGWGHGRDRDMVMGADMAVDGDIEHGGSQT